MNPSATTTTMCRWLVPSIAVYTLCVLVEDTGYQIMSNHVGAPPEWLNEEYIQKILREALKKPNLTVKKVDVAAGSAVGDNYACQIFRIIAYHGNGTEKISLIGKLKPDNTRVLDALDELDVMKVEGKFYTRVFNELKKVTNVEKLLAAPYHVDFDKNIILLEDLKEKNFYLQPRGQFLDFVQAKLVFEALATLHGSSVHIIQKDPSILAQFGKFLWSSKPEPVLAKFSDNALKCVDKLMNLFNLTPDQEKKLRGLKEKLDQDFFKVCDFQENKLNFLIHGDCWMNNMMFHKTDQNIDEVRLLDFQIVSYNSFANDLQYFLFTSVSTNVIFDHLDDLLKVYYNKLKEVAPNIPDLTLDRVKSEFRERYYYGLLLSIMFRPFVVAAVPVDMEKLLDGHIQDAGFTDPGYIADLKKFVDLFEKMGVL